MGGGGRGNPGRAPERGRAKGVGRVNHRALTDGIVAESFATMTRDELRQRLSDADIAFAEVNTMADLAVHPHLRRIEVDTPNGVVSYPAPAPIVTPGPTTTFCPSHAPSPISTGATRVLP